MFCKKTTNSRKSHFWRHPLFDLRSFDKFASQSGISQRMIGACENENGSDETRVSRQRSQCKPKKPKCVKPKKKVNKCKKPKKKVNKCKKPKKKENKCARKPQKYLLIWSQHVMDSKYWWLLNKFINQKTSVITDQRNDVKFKKSLIILIIKVKWKSNEIRMI